MKYCSVKLSICASIKNSLKIHKESSKTVKLLESHQFPIQDTLIASKKTLLSSAFKNEKRQGKAGKLFFLREVINHC